MAPTKPSCLRKSGCTEPREKKRTAEEMVEIVYGWSRMKLPPKTMCRMCDCCAERQAICPMLLLTMRSSESATSCAWYGPHMEVDAARASAKRMMPRASQRWLTPGRERMESTTSQKPSS